MERLVRVEGILRAPLVIVAAFVAVTCAALIVPLPTPVRTPVVLAFLAVVPGFVALRALQVRGNVVLLALVVPVSLAIDLLVATLILYVGAWSPALAFAVIAGACLGIAILDARLARRPLRVRAGRGAVGALRSWAISPHRGWSQDRGAAGRGDPPAPVEVTNPAPGPQGAPGTRNRPAGLVPPRASHRRTSTRSTVPDHLFEAPPSVRPTTDSFLDGLAERVERDR